VREAFIENFERRKELGPPAASTIAGEGRRPLGASEQGDREPWEEGTMALVHSPTKGMAGLAMALAHSRGLFDYDSP